MGLQAAIDLVVTDRDTACSMRSGEVPVLATPRLVALCEEATMKAMETRLADDQTSVGSSVELSHLVPIQVGSQVRATATLERCEGRRVVFSVSVTDHCGLVAAGRVTRVVVDKAAFLARAR
jgi:fluoroacetyl-CoA thioesterase